MLRFGSVLLLACLVCSVVVFHLREKAERSFAQNQAPLLLTAAAIRVIFDMKMDICLFII
jgi:hypothetical protein